MIEYVATIGFNDKATGLFIEAGAPYPPGKRVVSESWIHYLASESNGTGAPVIKLRDEVCIDNPCKVTAEMVGPLPCGDSEVNVTLSQLNGLSLEEVEEKVKDFSPEPDMLPVIEDAPKAKTPKKASANPFTPSPPAEKKDMFEGLSEKGIFDIFRMLNKGIPKSKVPETKEDYLEYLETDKWKKRNMLAKKDLLEIFGVEGAAKFKDYAVDKTLKDLLIRAINAKVKG